MTLVLNGKGLLLEGSNPKIEDKQVPGIYISPCSCSHFSANVGKIPWSIWDLED